MNFRENQFIYLTLIIFKMFLVRNTVYDNQNNIPYYNPNYEPQEKTSNPPDYGTSSQTYIIDGSGIEF